MNKGQVLLSPGEHNSTKYTTTAPDGRPVEFDDADVRVFHEVLDQMRKQAFRFANDHGLTFKSDVFNQDAKEAFLLAMADRKNFYVIGEGDIVPHDIAVPAASARPTLSPCSPTDK